MVLNVCAKRMTFMRFALNFNMFLVDYSKAERNGIYVTYYGYFASITSLLSGQYTLLRMFVPPRK